MFPTAVTFLSEDTGYTVLCSEREGVLPRLALLCTENTNNLNYNKHTVVRGLENPGETKHLE